ncbi:MAG TPA: bifunctional phosphoribosylaminoimidazolecarboxamide formyltransferase/IMP cyclohydrolase [Lentimicrobium sp.]|nr:bifunctional phosphoribosylaminoimidazolecarboxamide formyltransferase/IMP cyclohydrolase [Lentimicrobium sp.]
MSNIKTVRKALISVYYKEGLDNIIRSLSQKGVAFFSTGGTYDFIKSLGIECTKIEDLTGYPSILGGRVKTLHPKVFGGILGRPGHGGDTEDMKAYGIDTFDLVVVNLYPFEATLKSGASHKDIIEKIDIGGISLIRAAAKNYAHVLCISSPEQYPALAEIAGREEISTSEEERLKFAYYSFLRSSSYDTAIAGYMGIASDEATGNNTTGEAFDVHAGNPVSLRYGENPHQNGTFYGKLEDVFIQLHGKELSYNNLLDLEAGIALIKDFDETTFAILKHNNACGIASRPTLTAAWKAALEADPVSAYGGVLITNSPIDDEAAAEINKIFFEIILAPGYEKNALEILQTKKNRIILQTKSFDFQDKQFRSILNGVLVQDKDLKTETTDDIRFITNKRPDAGQMEDLLFANKIVKHSKSNAIVLASGKQLLASGIGQTSRVDALKQAIAKAQSFGLELRNAVMASDAYFPFADSVEIAHQAGITSVIQPGGSIRDNDTIEYCNKHDISMVFTGIRHFKH